MCAKCVSGRSADAGICVGGAAAPPSFSGPGVRGARGEAPAAETSSASVSDGRALASHRTVTSEARTANTTPSFRERIAETREERDFFFL